MDLKLFKYWLLVDLHFLDFSCTLSLISNLTPQTEQEVDLNCPPVMWSPQAGLIEIKCDQLHGAPDSTAHIIWQGDKKKKRARSVWWMSFHTGCSRSQHLQIGPPFLCQSKWHIGWHVEHKGKRNRPLALNSSERAELASAKKCWQVTTGSTSAEE